MMEREKVEELFDRRIRPGLMMDGGDIELVDVKGNTVYVKLVGACGSCPSATMTLTYGVERILRDEFPELDALITL